MLSKNESEAQEKFLEHLESHPNYRILKTPPVREQDWDLMGTCPKSGKVVKLSLRGRRDA